MPIARAVRIQGSGGVEVLSLEDVEIRSPGLHEVLVEVAAAGLNRADILQRKGVYPAPPGEMADVPGLEYAGKVAALGPGVTRIAVGDRVMGIVGGGGMATHVVAHESELVPVPRGLGLVEAAAIPEVFFTAYDALCMQAGLALGERVLLHAVGSGVGTAALQLACAAGAQVLGTSRTQSKLDKCKELGLEAGVLIEDGRFDEAVLEHTGGTGVDIIVDTIGAAYFEDNLRCLAPRGRLILLGLLGGASASAPLGLLLTKRLTVAGSVLRSRTHEEKSLLAQAVTENVLPLFTRGKLRPVVGEIISMENIAVAHQRMEDDENFGKIVLRW